MKTLAEHNRAAHEVFEKADDLNEPHANGIACPECGKELCDSNPCVTLTSYPPQKNVHCPACGFNGYRAA